MKQPRRVTLPTQKQELNLVPPNTIATMSLLSLPNELLLIIAYPLNVRDLNSLLRANRRLVSLLTQSLHEHATLPRVVHRPGFFPIHCALHWAAWKGYDGLFRLLLEKGLSITLCHSDSPRGESLLHFAARSGNEAIVKLLLEKGADANASSCHGETPLHYAVHCGQEAIVRLLLDHGASVDSKLPILICSMGYHMGVSGLWTVRHPACMNGEWDVNIANLLILYKAPADAQDHISGATALHQACRFGNLEMIKILLSIGASTTIRCRYGQTAFEWGLQWQTVEVVKFLQVKGLMPLLDGKYYDERKPQGRFEYWRLACGMGKKNRLRSLWKAFREGNPAAGASNRKRLIEYCKMRHGTWR